MDYFNYGNRRRGNSASQDRPNQPPSTPLGRPLSAQVSRESMRPPGRGASSIRLRRLPSGQITPLAPSALQQESQQAEQAGGGRRRSTSAPQRPARQDGSDAQLARQRSADPPRPGQMATLAEESPGLMSPTSPRPGAKAKPLPSPGMNAAADDAQRPPGPERLESGLQAAEEAGNTARANRGLRRFRSNLGPPRTRGVSQPPQPNEYDSDVVDLLDLVDPEVSTIGTLTNVQNSLFVPDLGNWLNRRPTYEITQRPTSAAMTAPRPRSRAGTRAAAEARQKPAGGLQPIQQGEEAKFDEEDDQPDDQSGASRRASITSDLSVSHYAVLPHGLSLEGWSEEEKAELNDHVRHLLHSRREGFKRSWRGFRKYVSKPLGLFVFTYALLVTVFGTVWVFLLIGWIYAGDERQDYIIDIIDNILVALFALMGDGMAPFRIIDTYHMCFIATYHHKTWEQREKKELPPLRDHNDLPRHRAESITDAALENGYSKEEQAEFTILTPEEQARLQYHQDKFFKSHTFYKPHETATHHAFPLRLLVAIVVLLDFHSIFQVALGTCTWSWNYKTRPEALTSSILACSLTCNITAGILINIGDKRTRKKDVLERLHRQDLTHEAIQKIQKRKTTEVAPVVDPTDKKQPSERFEKLARKNPDKVDPHEIDEIMAQQQPQGSWAKVSEETA